MTLSFNLAPGVVARRRRSTRSTRAEREIGLPASVRAAFQGTAQAFQASLVERADADPGRAPRRLHRARRALRELHPPDHDPLDAALGGVGALLALLLFKTEFSIIALIGIILLIGIVKKNAIMMIDFAIEAERDEGLSPRGGDLPGVPAALPADHDDDDGGAARRAAAGARHGTGSELRRPLGIAIVGGCSSRRC